VPDVIRVIKSRRIKFGKWGRKKLRARFGWVSLKEGDHLEGLGIEGRIIIKCAFQTQDGRAWTGFIWLRTRTSGGML
jgi:hypothetical protein